MTLLKEDAPQRPPARRELCNGRRGFVRAGCPWRMMPNDLPPWTAVQQQTRRWVRAGCFEKLAEDRRVLRRRTAGRHDAPTAAILDSHTLQSTPESGGRAGYDGAKKRKGRKGPAAVDTLGHVLALKVTAANEQDRAQVKELALAVQAATGQNIQLAYVEQGYTGEQPAADAAAAGPRLRTPGHHARRRPRAGFRPPHASSRARQKCMTGSISTATRGGAISRRGWSRGCSTRSGSC